MEGLYEVAKLLIKMEEIIDRMEKVTKSFKIVPVCPNCSGDHVVKKGFTANGKQRWLCRECGVTFTITSRYYKKIRELDGVDETVDETESFEEVAEYA